MKKIFVFLIVAIALCACDSVTADFMWTPTQPKAGESIYFMNLSNDGENWEWSFGDGETPSTKTNPTKVYKKPGTYQVTLRVDGKNSWTTSHMVTVADTLPIISLSDSTGLHYYQKNTFSVVLYNPYSYSYTLEWKFPQSAHGEAITETDTGNVATKATVEAFFSVHDQKVPVHCIVKMYKDTKLRQTFSIDTLMMVYDVPAPSLLIETTDGKLYRQRIYQLGLETATEEAYKTLTPQNRVADELNNKVYYVENSTLYCANSDGSNPQEVGSAFDGTLCLDQANNQLFWANSRGVMVGHLATNAYNKVTDVYPFAEGLNVRALLLDTSLR